MSAEAATKYRRIAWLRLSALIIAFLTLAGTGLVGVYDAFDEWREALTVMQRSVTAAGGIYGALGIIAAIGLVMRKTWSIRFAVAWAILSTYAGSVAVTVYGEAPNAVSATLGAFAACIVVTGMVVWLTAIGSRQIISYDEAPE